MNVLPYSRLITAVVLLLVAGPARGQSNSNDAPVNVDSVVLRLLHEANAPAQRAGVLTKLLAKEGDVVRKGDVLAELDERDAALVEQSARLELEIAKRKAENDIQVRFAAKANEVAAAELRRSEESVRSFPKSVSRSQMDVERLEVEKTALEREQAEHNQELSTMEVDVKKSAVNAARLERLLRRIAAPLDGVVVDAPAKLGEWLEPGQLAFRLVNVSRLKAEGFVTAADARRIAAGDQARLRLPGEEQEFTGRVVFVSPEIDPINNQVRVWAEIDNGQQLLRPGQHAEMAIEQANP